MPVDLTTAQRWQRIWAPATIPHDAGQTIEALLGEVDRLRAEALRFYHADGSYEVLDSPEEVVRRRQEAAVEIERFRRLNEDKFRTIQAYCKAADEDRAEIARLKAERGRLFEHLSTIFYYREMKRSRTHSEAHDRSSLAAFRVLTVGSDPESDSAAALAEHDRTAGAPEPMTEANLR